MFSIKLTELQNMACSPFKNKIFNDVDIYLNKGIVPFNNLRYFANEFYIIVFPEELEEAKKFLKIAGIKKIYITESVVYIHEKPYAYSICFKSKKEIEKLFVILKLSGAI